MKSIEELGISPLPWKVRTEPHGSFVTDANGSQSVAFCCEESVCSGGKVTHTPRKRNARLVSAAPELYECLREAVLLKCSGCASDAEEECLWQGECFAKKWRAALEKAGGAE